ncbi:hypothetical protein FGO68_gene3200 [Halteria grandinella]|uniref:Uncharacterized protein n=1 Tax=Halteria grandinella TaxID=5974 RepID=A0A8J8NCN3_HALGN|nr:hypothetical protein FGO68_gene3200 [Halteria grandinella]
MGLRLFYTGIDLISQSTQVLQFLGSPGFQNVNFKTSPVGKVLDPEIFLLNRKFPAFIQEFTFTPLRQIMPNHHQSHCKYQILRFAQTSLPQIRMCLSALVHLYDLSLVSEVIPCAYNVCTVHRDYGHPCFKDLLGCHGMEAFGWGMGYLDGLREGLFLDEIIKESQVLFGSISLSH